MFSLQQILGHTTLDMVRRYVNFASFETVRRLHAAASPADGLIIGPKVSLFIPRAWASVLEDLAEASRVMVQDVIREAIARLVAKVVSDTEFDGRLTTYHACLKSPSRRAINPLSGASGRGITHAPPSACWPTYRRALSVRELRF